MILLSETIQQRYSVTKKELMNIKALKGCSFIYGNRHGNYFLKDGEPFSDYGDHAIRKNWDFFKEDETFIAILNFKKSIEENG